MSKEFKSFCLTSQVQDCPLPKRKPGKGIWAHCPSPSRAVGSTAGFQAAEVPPHIRDCSFQLAVVLSRHFPALGVHAAPTQREDSLCCREPEHRGAPAGEVKLESVETSQSYTDRRITPTPESENEMIIAP